MSRRDGLWQDGGRLQSWVRRRAEIRSRSRTGGWSGAELGLVIGLYYPDDDGTRDGVVTEYDVYVPRYQVTLERITQVVPYQGTAGGQQVTLKAASGRPDAQDPNRHWQNVMESDGDLVVVQYIGGKLPVIVGCVNHIRGADSASWHTGSSDGEVLATTYNTTRARFDSDGNMEVDFNDSYGAHDRSLTVNVDGEQFLKVTQDGASGDVRIELGGKAGKALEKGILGERFQEWMNKDVPVLEGGPVHHTHSLEVTSGSSVGTYETSEPVAPGSALLPVPVSIPDMPNNHLTEKVKLEEE